MKKLLTLATCSVIAAVVAQQPAVQQARNAVAQTCVEESLQDDGICIVTAPDGSFQIFTRGSGTYQFVNPKAENNARKVARANAQKNLVEYLNGLKLKAEDSLESLQKNSLKMTGDGQVQQQQSSMEDMETVASTIKTSTEGIIHGLVTVESRKIPTEGTTGGTIQVTMVYSSKTDKAAGWAAKKMQDHQADLKINEARNESRVNAERQKANTPVQTAPLGNTVDTPSTVPASPQPAGTTPANKAERRVNKTEF